MRKDNTYDVCVSITAINSPKLFDELILEIKKDGGLRDLRINEYNNPKEIYVNFYYGASLTFVAQINERVKNHIITNYNPEYWTDFKEFHLWNSVCCRDGNPGIGWFNGDHPNCCGNCRA